MQIVSAYLLASASKAGYDDNILPEGDENISNWSLQGELSNSFLDGENNVTFTNDGNGQLIGPNGQHYKYRVNVYNPSTQHALANAYWSRYPFCVTRDYTVSGSDPTAYYLLTGCRGAGGSAGKLASCTFTQKYRQYNVNPSKIAGDTISTWESDGVVGGQKISGTEAFAVFQTLWQPNLTADDIARIGGIKMVDTAEDTYSYISTGGSGYLFIEAELPTTTGKEYVFRFDACSPSGFDTGAVDQVSIVSGTEEVFATIPSEASSTLATYELRFTAGADTAKVKIDFSRMISATEISFKIANMKFYEVG